MRKNFERYLDGFIYWTSSTKADEIVHILARKPSKLYSFFSSSYLLRIERITVARMAVFSPAAEVVEATVAVVYESAFAEYVDHIWTDGRFKHLK